MIVRPGGRVYKQGLERKLEYGERGLKTRLRALLWRWSRYGDRKKEEKNVQSMCPESVRGRCHQKIGRRTAIVRTSGRGFARNCKLLFLSYVPLVTSFHCTHNPRYDLAYRTKRHTDIFEVQSGWGYVITLHQGRK